MFMMNGASNASIQGCSQIVNGGSSGKGACTDKHENVYERHVDEDEKLSRILQFGSF